MHVCVYPSGCRCMPAEGRKGRWTCVCVNYNGFLGGLSLHLNHLIAQRLAICDRPFGTLLIGIFLSNLDT